MIRLAASQRDARHAVSDAASASPHYHPMPAALRSILGVFARHPTPGRVKTRLAAALGPDAAAALYAAFTQDPDKSGSTDKALHTVLQQPFGPYLLMALAAGIACYGLFNFARARHLAK